MQSHAISFPHIQEEVLRSPQYPVHKIAERLLPYLTTLVEQFSPKQVILFGSYAYGSPDAGSDVDLIIIKGLMQSPIKEASAIRKAWRPLRWTQGSIPFDLLVLNEAGHRQRMMHSAGFYEEAVTKGLRLV